MNRLARNNFRCAVAYWIKVGRRCDHGRTAPPGDLRDWATSWGPWWPTNQGKDEARACIECGRMEKRPADHSELAAIKPEGINS